MPIESALYTSCAITLITLALSALILALQYTHGRRHRPPTA